GSASSGGSITSNDGKFENITPESAPSAPVETGTQTDDYDADTPKHGIGMPIFTGITIWLGLSWTISLAGLAAVVDQLKSNCIQVNVTGSDGQSAVVNSCGPGFGMSWFALFLELFAVAGIYLAIKYRTWYDYKLLLAGLMLLATAVFTVSVDFILTISALSPNDSLVSSADAAAAGFIMMLMGNYLLFLLILPASESAVGRFLARPNWPKINWSRFRRKRAPFNPEEGAAETGN
ncbi:hypothetical protein SARC_09320, partial [Sphaeroforma arctica JP610]